MKKVTSKRPYLLRAWHEWMSDNLQTPHIVVDARQEGVQVPGQHVEDGKIILNVSHHATRSLELGNDVVQFQARFNGVDFPVRVPVRAVMAIYARETAQGMIFTSDDLDSQPEPDTGEAPDDKRPDKEASEGNRPDLKIVR